MLLKVFKPLFLYYYCMPRKKSKLDELTETKRKEYGRYFPFLATLKRASSSCLTNLDETYEENPKETIERA